MTSAAIEDVKRAVADGCPDGIVEGALSLPGKTIFRVIGTSLFFSTPMNRIWFVKMCKWNLILPQQAGGVSCIIASYLKSVYGLCELLML